MKRAIFLDRDGVINKAPIIDGLPYSPRTIDEIEIIHGVNEAIIGLKSLGFVILVVTNQPDVARGIVEKRIVLEINDYLGARLGVDDFFVCWHDDLDYCDCRKPNPGLIKMAAEKYSIKLNTSFLVGDRWKDIAAAHSSEVEAYFIDYGYSERNPEPPFTRVSSLFEAYNSILDSETSGTGKVNDR